MICTEAICEYHLNFFAFLANQAPQKTKKMKDLSNWESSVNIIPSFQTLIETSKAVVSEKFEFENRKLSLLITRLSMLGNHDSFSDVENKPDFWERRVCLDSNPYWWRHWWKKKTGRVGKKWVRLKSYVKTERFSGISGLLGFRWTKSVTFERSIFHNWKVFDWHLKGSKLFWIITG